MNRFVIGEILVGDEVANTVRQQLRKIVPGLKIELPEIQLILKSEIVKREIFEGAQAIKAASLIKKTARLQKKVKTTLQTTATE